MCVFFCVFEHLPLSYPRSSKNEFGDTFVFILTRQGKPVDIFTNTKKSPPAAFSPWENFYFLGLGPELMKTYCLFLLFWDPLGISYRCSYCKSPHFYYTMAELQLHFGTVSGRSLCGSCVQLVVFNNTLIWLSIIDILNLDEIIFCVCHNINPICSINHVCCFLKCSISLNSLKRNQKNNKAYYRVSDLQVKIRLEVIYNLKIIINK